MISGNSFKMVYKFLQKKIKNEVAIPKPRHGWHEHDKRKFK